MTILQPLHVQSRQSLRKEHIFRISLAYSLFEFNNPSSSAKELSLHNYFCKDSHVVLTKWKCLLKTHTLTNFPTASLQKQAPTIESFQKQVPIKTEKMNIFLKIFKTRKFAILLRLMVAWLVNTLTFLISFEIGCANSNLRKT